MLISKKEKTNFVATGYLSGAYYKITGAVPICSLNTDKVIVVVRADSKYMLIDDIVKAEKKINKVNQESQSGYKASSNTEAQLSF